MTNQKIVVSFDIHANAEELDLLDKFVADMAKIGSTVEYIGTRPKDRE